MIKIFVTNLGLYNEGFLLGDWLDLPASEEEISELLERIQIDGVNYEEYFITDSECDIDGLEIGEYSSITHLNKIADDLADVDIEELNLIHEALGTYDIKQCIQIWEDRNFTIFNNVDNQSDLGFDYIQEVYGRPAEMDKDIVLQHIDMEQLGLYLTTSVEWFYNEYYDVHINMTNRETGEFFLKFFGLEALTMEEIENCFDYEDFAKDYLFDYTIMDGKAIAILV